MTEKNFRSNIQIAVEKVRAENPLTPSITNTVTQDFVANAQFAVGGSVMMIYLPDEGETMAGTARAMYINLGTLMPYHAETIPRTLRALAVNNTPFVLDIVAIGIGNLRTELLMQMKNFKPTIIRGNPAEVTALAKLWDVNYHEGEKVFDIETVGSVDEAAYSAIELARFTKGAVAVSGSKDLITDGEVAIFSSGGSSLLTSVAGGGCALGGVMATYLTVASPIIAAFTATAIFNCAGTRAAKNTSAPASFKVEFLDELFKISAIDVASSEFEVVHC